MDGRLICTTAVRSTAGSASTSTAGSGRRGRASVAISTSTRTATRSTGPMLDSRTPAIPTPGTASDRSTPRDAPDTSLGAGGFSIFYCYATLVL